MDADTPPLYADNLPDMTGATVVNVGAGSAPFNWTTDTQSVLCAANAKTIIRYPTTRKYMGTLTVRVQRGSIVQIIGGHCNIGLTSTGDDPQQGGSGQQSGATMLKFQESGTFNSADVAYIFHEGTYFDGASGPVSPLFGAGNPCECDAQDVNTPHTIIWRKNVRTEGLIGDLTTGHKHADSEQTAGGYREIHHEDCHYQSHYNNIYHRRENSPLGAVEGKLFINRVHCDSYNSNPVPGAQVDSTLRAVSLGLQPDDANGGPGNDNSLQNGLLAHGVWLKDLYGSPPGTRPLNQFMHPRAGGSVPAAIAPVMNADGTQAWWPNWQTFSYPPADETTPSTPSTVGSGDAQVYGVLHKGPPPWGDFAPATMVGLNYTGPFTVVPETGASFSTGFEHGTLSIFDSVTGTPTIDTTPANVRNGTRSLKAVSTPGIHTANHTVSGNYISARFAFKMDALPTGGHARIFSAQTAISNFIIALGTGGALFANILTGGTAHGPASFVLGQWYLIEIECDSSTQTHTINWRVNGVDQTPITMAAATSSPFTTLSIGQSNSNSTSTVYVDDYAWTQDQSRGFLGDGRVLGLAINSVGVHTNPANFQTNAGVAISNTSDTSWQLVDEVPPSITDYVKQTVIGAGAWLTYKTADTAETLNPVVVTAYAGLSAAGTGANDATVKVTTDLVNFANVFSGSIATTGLKIASLVMFNKPGSSSGGWTAADLNGLRFRFGYSADVTPNPYLAWLFVEAEFPALTAGNTAKSDSDTGAGVDSATLAMRFASIDGGVATDAATAVTQIVQGTDAGTATETAVLVAQGVTGTDTASASETAAEAIKNAGQDSGSGSDSATETAAYTLPDGSVASTDQSALAAAYTNVDTGSGTDASNVRLVVADTGTGADVMSRSTPVSDSGLVNDIAAVSLAGSVFTASDAATGNDAAVLTVNYPLTDTATAAEVVLVNVATADSGSSTETGLETHAETLPDTGSGTETSSLRHAEILVDTGSAAESASQVASYPVNDSAVGADLIAERFATTVADTGSGSDAATLVATASGSDAGAGADGAGTSASVVGNDEGVGTEDYDLLGAKDGNDEQALVVTETARTKRKHRIYRPNTIVLEPHAHQRQT